MLPGEQARGAPAVLPQFIEELGALVAEDGTSASAWP